MYSLPIVEDEEAILSFSFSYFKKVILYKFSATLFTMP